jgi:hypothetical protein
VAISAEVFPRALVLFQAGARGRPSPSPLGAVDREPSLAREVDGVAENPRELLARGRRQATMPVVMIRSARLSTRHET